MKQRIDAAVEMRDGVRLSADVRMPDAGGPFPAIVFRTPYGNAGFSDAEKALIDAGYAVVRQDCRGRFDSAGVFDPFKDDEDGHDTIAWVARQPWCDGRVGMSGGSYAGFTQYAAAWTSPPALRALTASVMGEDLFRGCVYHDGVFNLSVASVWGSNVAGRSAQTNDTTDWDRLFRHLPLKTLDEAAGYSLEYFKEWLAHPVYDSYWAGRSLERHIEGVDVPTLLMGGWYDLYGVGIMRVFSLLRSRGGPRARANTRVVMGPWVHGINQRLVGQLDFGENAIIGVDGMKRRWLDRWVKEEENGAEQGAPVRIFVMGDNTWRDENEWPLARTRWTDLFLTSGGRANSLYGDGALAAAPADDAGADRYVYNPDNPVPVAGGACLRATNGPTDHSPIERRDDVLVYTGPVLEQPLEVTGPVRATLYARSDAVDTDFVARLCDVWPDGRSFILCDGIARARFREGLDREVMMKPGEVYEFAIDMAVTSSVFKPGHRVRLEVTSSCFPRFDRNLNSGESLAEGTRVLLARQEVLHSRAYPSRVTLPVIPREG